MASDPSISFPKAADKKEAGERVELPHPTRAGLSGPFESGTPRGP
jgi:hypothetical protein